MSWVEYYILNKEIHYNDKDDKDYNDNHDNHNNSDGDSDGSGYHNI